MPKGIYDRSHLLRPIKQRFDENWKLNEQTGCWEWQGYFNIGGYGQIGILQDTKLAHRVGYEIYVGAIPKGMYVCHHCDNPKCVNPSHLFIGTHSDNMRDMSLKGRNGNKPKHGSLKMYNLYKCRCELCVERHKVRLAWAREYDKKRVPRNRKSKKAA